MTPIGLKQKFGNLLFSSTPLPFHRWEYWHPQKWVLCSLKALSCDSHFAFLEAEGDNEGKKRKKPGLKSLWGCIMATEEGPELLWLWGSATTASPVLCLGTRQSSEWRQQQGHKLPGAHAVLTLFWCTAWHRTHLPCVHLPLGCSCDLGRFREDWFWIPGDCQPPDVLKQPSEVYKVLWFPSSPSILLFSPLFKSFLPHSLVYLRCKKVNIPLALRVLQSSGPSQCCQRLHHALSRNFSHVSFVSYVISPSLGMKHLHQWKFDLLQVISGNKLT